MPQSTNTDTLNRQWKTLEILQMAPSGLTVKKLIEKLCKAGCLNVPIDENAEKASKRKVERDLNKLQSVFPQLKVQGEGIRRNGEHNTWFIDKEESLDFPSMSLKDTVALSILDKLYQSYLPENIGHKICSFFKKAHERQKVFKHFPEGKIANVIHFDEGSPLLRQTISKNGEWDLIIEAIINKKQLQCRYSPHYENTANYTLHPVCILLRGSVPYLLAKKFPKGKVIPFRISRLRNVTLLDDEAELPSSFSLEEYMKKPEVFGNQGEIMLVAKVDRYLANRLTENQLAKDQTLDYLDSTDINKGFLLKAKVENTWDLQNWIMAQGANFTVMKPQSLREDIKQELKEALEAYIA